jgi:hypothetical protein
MGLAEEAKMPAVEPATAEPGAGAAVAPWCLDYRQWNQVNVPVAAGSENLASEANESRGELMAAAAIEALNRQRSLSRSPYLVPSDAQNQYKPLERYECLLRCKNGSCGYDVRRLGDGNALCAVVEQ